MSKPVDPVVGQICAQETQDPGPGAVPGQGDYVESLIHPHEGCQLCSTKQQTVENNNNILWSIRSRQKYILEVIYFKKKCFFFFMIDNIKLIIIVISQLSISYSHTFKHSTPFWICFSPK